MTHEQMVEAVGVMQFGLAKITAALAKSSPGVGDVHVSSADPKKKKPLAFLLDDGVDKEEGDEAVEKSIDFRMSFDLKKAAPDQQRVWGWASVSQLGDTVVIDKQGDIIPIESLERGAYDFVLNSRSLGDMHAKMDVGNLIEAMVFTPEKESLGIVAKNESGKSIYGLWIGFEVRDPDVWADYKAGKRPEFSIGGKASYTER